MSEEVFIKSEKDLIKIIEKKKFLSVLRFCADRTWRVYKCKVIYTNLTYVYVKESSNAQKLTEIQRSNILYSSNTALEKLELKYTSLSDTYTPGMCIWFIEDESIHNTPELAERLRKINNIINSGDAEKQLIAELEMYSFSFNRAYSKAAIIDGIIKRHPELLDTIIGREDIYKCSKLLHETFKNIEKGPAIVINANNV